MRFRRYTPSVAACAAGFITGVLYDKFKFHQQFTLLSIDRNIDISEINKNSRAINSAPCMKLGFPSFENLELHKEFVLSYDNERRNLNWVMEYLTLDNITQESSKTASRKKKKFRGDEALVESFRALNLDYQNSGYDRGHLAASGNYQNSQESLNATFVLSNAVPQNRHLNRNLWHSLEEHVRSLVRKYGNSYVCTGPLYLHRVVDAEKYKLLKEVRKDDNYKQKWEKEDEFPKKVVIYEVIGENNVAVPTHLFKAIATEVGEGEYVIESYIIPNERLKNSTLSYYKTSLNEINNASGLSIFNNIKGSIKENEEVKENEEDEENNENVAFNLGRSL